MLLSWWKKYPRNFHPIPPQLICLSSWPLLLLNYNRTWTTKIIITIVLRNSNPSTQLVRGWYTKQSGTGSDDLVIKRHKEQHHVYSGKKCENDLPLRGLWKTWSEWSVSVTRLKRCVSWAKQTNCMINICLRYRLFNRCICQFYHWKNEEISIERDPHSMECVYLSLNRNHMKEGRDGGN